MKFPNTLPFDVRCGWENALERNPLTHFGALWREVGRFGDRHGINRPLPANPPDDVIRKWQELARRRASAPLADHWTAVVSWANENGYEISVGPEPYPEGHVSA